MIGDGMGPAFLAALAVLFAGVAVRPRPPARAAAPGSPRAARPPGRWARRAHGRAVAAAYPEALELVVLAVRAGHLPAAAVRAVVPHLATAVAPAFAAVVAEVEAGRRFADALGRLTEHLGPIAAPLADSLAAAERYGLPLAPVLDRLAAEARHQRRRHTEALARQLPVRLSLPLVLCTLPSFVLLAVVPLLVAALGSLSG